MFNLVLIKRALLKMPLSATSSHCSARSGDFQHAMNNYLTMTTYDCALIRNKNVIKVSFILVNNNADKRS